MGTTKNIPEGYKDEDREQQFYNLVEYLGFNKSYIITQPKHNINYYEPLKNKIIDKEFIRALKKINVKIENVSMIITHSFYGDERKHPHHIKLYEYFSKYTFDNNIPFGFFSIIKIPNINHKSILHSTYKFNNLHILSYDTVDDYVHIKNYPTYMIEFGNEINIKKKALKLYKSVDYNKHIKDYVSISCLAERLYFNK